MQVNYDFYENLDPDKVDAILEQLQEGKRPQPVPVIAGALHERHPAEVPRDQQALRHPELAQNRRLSEDTTAIRRSKKR